MFALWMRRWVTAAVLAPLAGRVVERVAGRMESRRGVTSSSRRLREGGAMLRGRRLRGRRY